MTQSNLCFLYSPLALTGLVFQGFSWFPSDCTKQLHLIHHYWLVDNLCGVQHFICLTAGVPCVLKWKWKQSESNLNKFRHTVNTVVAIVPCPFEPREACWVDASSGRRAMTHNNGLMWTAVTNRTRWPWPHFTCVRKKAGPLSDNEKIIVWLEL